MSSSPLPIPSSDDDVAMAIDDELPQTPTPHGGQSMSQAPPADPLFLAGTPSTQAGTPLRGVVARRAVGMHSTPRGSGRPLFAREYNTSWLGFRWTVVLTHAYQLVHHPAPHTFLHLRLQKTRIGYPEVEKVRAGPVQI
jgi:hypothetical protein